MQAARCAEQRAEHPPLCPPSICPLSPPLHSYAFSVWFPLTVQLRKELGELLVALGLVGGALQLFESLELWDNLIVCYQLLNKRVQVRRLVWVGGVVCLYWLVWGSMCVGREKVLFLRIVLPKGRNLGFHLAGHQLQGPNMTAAIWPRRIGMNCTVPALHTRRSRVVGEPAPPCPEALL